MCKAPTVDDSSEARRIKDLYYDPNVKIPKTYAETQKEWRLLPGDYVTRRWAFRVLILVPLLVLLACFSLDTSTHFAYTLTVLKMILFYRFLFESFRKFIVFPKWFYAVSRATSSQDKECYGWKHLVVLTLYQDSAATLVDTLRSLDKQTVASSITVMVTFEERSPDKENKIRQIKEALAGHNLGGLHFTIHPKGLPGEQANMMSNCNWGAYQLMDRLGLVGEGLTSSKLNKRSFTIGDCDIIVHPTYFQTMGKMLESEEEPDRAFYTGSVFFYLNMAAGPWLASCLAHSFAGFIAAENIHNNLSVFLPDKFMMPLALNTHTVTLRTMLASGFCHPERIQTDGVCYGRNLTACRGHLVPRIVPSIIFTEPATGGTTKEQFNASMTQWIRWAQGYYQLIDYLIQDTFTSFKDPVALVLWWAQFLHVKVWYGAFWDLHISMILLPLAPSFLSSEEIIANFGWLGSFFVSYSWIQMPLDIFLILATMLGPEYYANWIMAKHFTNLKSSFGVFQTLVHLSVSHLLYIPNFFVQWIAVCREFFGSGGIRIFGNSPKLSLQRKLKVLVATAERKKGSLLETTQLKTKLAKAA